jgi:colanic acid/amylovoran biosynthesis protein
LKSICLLWHSFRSENLGVGALSVAQVNLLDAISKDVGCSLKIVVLGTYNDSVRGTLDFLNEKHDFQFVERKWSLREFVKRLICFDFSELKSFRDIDVFIDIGEGDSFSDIYGFNRFFNLWVTKFIPLMVRRPLVLAPQTIGPFSGGIPRIMAKFILRFANRVYSRDSLTSRYLKSVSVKHFQSSDLAFCLPYELEEPQKDWVGINISALLWNGGYTKDNQFGLGLDYRELINGLIDYFCVRKGKKVVLIPHVLSSNMPVEDDYSVCQGVAKFRGDVEVSPRFQHPSAAKAYISQLGFFLGSRMHSTIAAASSNVPVIPLSYSRKFEGVFSLLGYEYTLNLYECASVEAALSFVSYNFENNLSLMQNQLVQSNLRARGFVDEYAEYLESLLSDG